MDDSRIRAEEDPLFRLKPVLVTGATGYVGGRLVPRLLEAGYRVRVMSRSMEKLSSRLWADHPMLEAVRGDVLSPDSLQAAVQGCRAAYYLVHSMNPHTEDYVKTDRIAARNMTQAAAQAGIERIIYLGGLIPDEPDLTHHLSSRAEVGRILQSGPVPATVLQAPMILGCGSASFEMMRYLVERMPILITPKGINNKVQPIFIRNVLNYLIGCLENEAVRGGAFDICGPDILTYRELFQIYAEEAGLRPRLFIVLPFVSEKLSAYWIHLFTPVHASLARPLAEGLRHNVVCRENRISQIIPQDLMDCRATIRRILQVRREKRVETSWTDAGLLIPPEWEQIGDADYAGGEVREIACRIRIQAKPAAVWDLIVRLGGENGWYVADAVWRFLGRVDKLFGGVGITRGRRHPVKLSIGDALDFWRVLEIWPFRRLFLVGEMKSPGEILMDFQLSEYGTRATELKIISRFFPRGVVGLTFGFFLIPVLRWMCKRILIAISNRCSEGDFQKPEFFMPTSEELAWRKVQRKR